MKSIFVLCSVFLIVVLVLPAFGQNNNVFADSDNTFHQEDNAIRRGLHLPSAISRWIPDFSKIFSSALNAFAGKPAVFVSSILNTMCNSLIYTGFLKPNHAPPISDLHLEFYTKNDVAVVPLSNPAKLVNIPGFDISINLTIFVHSWKTIGRRNNIVDVLAQAYAKRTDYNFVVFDVSDYVSTVFQWTSFDTKKVGYALADAILSLRQYVPVQNIHLIGHDLGAHIAGMAGRRIIDVTRDPLKRITAFDPASTCYDNKKGFYGLERGDARFIDVIHSNNGVFGKGEPVGDVDFYPNGATHIPPGCLDLFCAHTQAVHYYAESVVPGSEENFFAAHCESYKAMKSGDCHGRRIYMGLVTPLTAKGVYYLQTNAQEPYGKETS